MVLRPGGPGGRPGRACHPGLDLLEGGAGAERSRSGPGARREPRAGGRRLQPRQREARADRERSAGEQARAAARAEEPQALPGSMLSARLVEMYTSGNENTGLDVLLGASSIDDLISRIDTMNRVSDQSTEVLRQVKVYRTAVKQRRARLQTAHVQQAELVAERSAQKASIEGQLAERQQLLSSIKSQIARCRRPNRPSRPSSQRRHAPGSRPPAPPCSTQARAPWSIRPPPMRRLLGSTAASSGLRCSTWERRTSGEGRALRASTAPGSSCTSSRRSASRCRTTRRLSTGTECPSRATSSSPVTSSSSTGSGTTGSTSAAASSSTRRTRATW